MQSACAKTKQISFALGEITHQPRFHSQTFSKPTSLTMRRKFKWTNLASSTGRVTPEPLVRERRRRTAGAEPAGSWPGVGGAPLAGFTAPLHRETPAPGPAAEAATPAPARRGRPGRARPGHVRRVAASANAQASELARTSSGLPNSRRAR